MRLLILALLLYIIYRVIRSYFGSGQKMREEKIRKGNEAGVIDEMVQDPICKTYIPLREAKRRVFDGETYFFCSDQCADEFEKEKA
jgi:YHS domain-containing protein